MALPARPFPSRAPLVWAALLVGAIGVAVVVVLWWLPGPRASLPGGTQIASGSSPSLRSPIGLPDPHRTPGSVNPNVTEANLAATICMSGWTRTVRPPSAYTNALKLVQIVEYGYADRKPSDYEEDHLVPLELGGAARDPANLWPEPRQLVLADGTNVDSNAKDGLENYLHTRVCSGLMPLADAQRLIAGDWIAAWAEAGRP
jgi:hypothetical protein